MKKIIVDTNIVFSSLVNTNGKIASLLGNPPSDIQYFSPEYLRTEIHKHREKLIKSAKISPKEFEISQSIIYSFISFIPEVEIPYNCWADNAPLLRDVDMNDLPFIALTDHLSGRLWTGDKELINGLLGKGYKQCVSTQELYAEFSM